ncbi:MAG: PAS domain S-box protein [Kiritimatiellae bacterium]|nr:PAS domain S-box protein [Kiritimatiellia bacterium]
MSKKEQAPKASAPAESPDAEQQLRQVLAGARCILWHALVNIGPDGHPLWQIRIFNEEAAEQLHPLNRAPGRTYSDVWQEWTLPEDRRRIDETSEQALRAGAPGYSQEFRSRRADGQVRWLYEDARIQPLGPERWLVIGVCTDITKQKEAEAAQRAVSEGLRTVVAIADHLLSCADLDTLCRQAVELLRQRLRIERCAIFLREGDHLTGTYGTNRQGATTDEHKHRFPATKEWIERIESLRLQERHMLVMRQRYHEWDGDRTIEFGHGWVAITPIMSTREFIGVFCNDSAISGAPMDETTQEIVSVFCSLLGAIIERKRTETTHAAMSGGLKAVLSIADLLIACDDMDTLYRRAVELAREQLGVERCGLFLQEGRHLRGTYGIDHAGNVTREDTHEVSESEEWLQRFHSMRLEERRTLVFHQRYIEWSKDREERFGYGWVAATPIQSATEFLGVFFNDAAISGAPIDETTQEIFSVYSSLLGAIIARKRTENRLRAASEGLRAVVAIADELIACRDLDCVCRRAVELAREKLGVERCSLFLSEGKQLRGTYGTTRTGATSDEHDHVIGEQKEWLEQFHATRMQERRTIIVEQPYVEWDKGRETKFSHGWIAVTPIQSASSFIGAFCNDTAVSGAPPDTTRQEILSVFGSMLGAIIEGKRAEAETRRLAMAIQQEAEAVVITDPAGTIRYVNPAFERMTGYTAAEVQGRNPRLLKSGRQDAAFYQEMWNTLTRGDVWSGRLTNRKKDGTFYELESTISPIRDEAGHVINYVATSRDVTREVELEQQIRRAQKMDAVGRLAGGIAHDFNNLLTSVLGYSRIVHDQLGDGHPLQADLAEISRAGERAVNLTKQLLAFSRKQTVEARSLSLNAVVMDVDKLLRRTLGENIELVALLDSEMAYVKADAGLLEQVILNLAVNARDAMPEGGSLTIRTATIELSPEDCLTRVEVRPGRYVLLSARDTGVGMTPEVRDQCFEPFYTSKPQGKGTGLGLSIVYGIIKQFGGFIELDTSPGRGTEVRIYLPAAGPPAGMPEPRAKVELPRGTETILVVEDEETVRRLTVRILQSLGYNVIDAAQGGEALLICERHRAPIDLVLTDVVMPHIGGPEMVKRLRGIRSDFEVLYMSGFAEDAFVQGELGHDSPRFIAKPFTHEALALKVRAILDQRAAAPAAARRRKK